MRQWMIRAKDALKRQEPVVLIFALLLVCAGWALVEITDDVLEGDTQKFDERVIRTLRKPGPEGKMIPVGPEWLKAAMLDVTALGGVAVLTLLVAGVLGFLVMIRHYHMMWLVLAATVGAAVVNTAVKMIIARPRPLEELRLQEVSTMSFPSGHSALSAAVYLTLGSLLAQTVKRRKHKAYFLFIALGITLLVGVSRVYLGVHYPSDVMAGWTSGLIWAIAVWLVGRYLQRRGKIEQEADPAPAMEPKFTPEPEPEPAVETKP
jgi:undecaprenyl-diphosphatase